MQNQFRGITARVDGTEIQHHEKFEYVELD